MSQETLIMVYYAYFHSLMSFGIIFWGNSPCSIHIFRLQKKITKITNSRNRSSCRNWLKNLKIFTFISQYIFSLLSFDITNTKLWSTNSNIHNRNTRYGSVIHQTISNLSLHQEVLIIRDSRFLMFYLLI
jgi:hypothetical protein